MEYGKLFEMPPEKSNIGRPSRHVRHLSASRSADTPEEREALVENSRAFTSRAAETSDDREAVRIRASTSRARIDLKKPVFNYNKDYDNRMHCDVAIGPTTDFFL